MDINIKRFVDIDIQYHTVSTISSIRDTVVLLTDEGDKGTNKIFNSYSAMLADDTFKTYQKALSYAKVYFENNGIKLDVRCGITNEKIIEALQELPTTEIVVGYTGSYDAIKAAATLLSSSAYTGTTGEIDKIYGINQKILLGRTQNPENLSSVSNFAVKVSTIVGAEMTIGAYLSKINIYGNDTVRDYAFTVESFANDDTKIVNDDTLLGNVLDNNMNVDMRLANAIRNLGGNLTNGLDIVNQYVLIVLHQTVTDRLVNLLTQKIKGNAGISAIYTTIASELSKYLTNGYLTTDKVWTDNTKTIDYNGKTYTLIEQGTTFDLGYNITILPLESLNDEDKVKRKCPPIYIFLADSYGIRNITINGEVI